MKNKKPIILLVVW